MMIADPAPLSYESPTKALWHPAATEDNQTAIAKAGGIAPLVSLLSSPITAQYASAALRTVSTPRTRSPSPRLAPSRRS